MTQNANTRDAARHLVARGGYAGMVAGHTHRCELSEVPGGFYANTGSCTRVIDRVRARFRLPAVYLPRLQLSWIVLECEDDWSVRLFAARRTSEEHRGWSASRPLPTRGGSPPIRSR